MGTMGRQSVTASSVSRDEYDHPDRGPGRGAQGLREALHGRPCLWGSGPSLSRPPNLEQSFGLSLSFLTCWF